VNGQQLRPARSIGCPIAWCTGDASTHGDEGDGPDTWLHADAGRDLGHEARIYRHQEGAGRSTYSLAIGTSTVIEAADSPDALAAILRAIAARTEQGHPA